MYYIIWDLSSKEPHTIKEAIFYEIQKRATSMSNQILFGIFQIQTPVGFLLKTSLVQKMSINLKKTNGTLFKLL